MSTGKSNLLPRFSIVIPFKKGKEYLQYCVESVRRQTFRDFELVILADTDSNFEGELDWLDSLLDDTIRIERSKKTLNINENWKRIGQIARGEYLTILGYDDILYPHYLSLINDLIKSNPEANLYLTHFDFINSSGEKFETSPSMEHHISAPLYLDGIFRSRYFIMATGYMMKTSDYLKVGGIPVSYPNLLYADFELWHRIIDLKYLAVSPEVGFSFRIHQSTTKVTNAKLMLICMERFINYLTTLREQSEYQNIMKEALSFFLISHCNEICYKALRTPGTQTDRLTVKAVIAKFNGFGAMLGVEPINYLSNQNIRLAYRVDSNLFLRYAYLKFRRTFKKPFLTFKNTN